MGAAAQWAGHGSSQGTCQRAGPFVWCHRHYRKTLLARMPALNYLDDSPVFPKDRRLAQAFVDGGGVEAERAMRETIRQGTHWGEVG